MQVLADTSVGHTYKQKLVCKNPVCKAEGITILSEEATLFDKWYRDNWLTIQGEKIMPSFTSHIQINKFQVMKEVNVISLG